MLDPHSMFWGVLIGTHMSEDVSRYKKQLVLFYDIFIVNL